MKLLYAWQCCGRSIPMIIYHKPPPPPGVHVPYHLVPPGPHPSKQPSLATSPPTHRLSAPPTLASSWLALTTLALFCGPVIVMVLFAWIQ